MGRENFNIQEKRKINEEQQFIQVEQSDHIIQLLVRVLPDTVFQNIALVSTQHNDLFEPGSSKPVTISNHSGGVQGGITNGSEIIFRVAFKPTATISTPQETVDSSNKPITLEAKGRHDPCVLPRAVPMVEAMTLLVMADHWLRNQSAKIPTK